MKRLRPPFFCERWWSAESTFVFGSGVREAGHVLP
jgi:hypothetical protein